MDLFDNLPPPKAQASAQQNATEKQQNSKNLAPNKEPSQVSETSVTTKGWSTMILKPVIRKPQKAKKIVMPAFKSINLETEEKNTSTTIKSANSSFLEPEVSADKASTIVKSFDAAPAKTGPAKPATKSVHSSHTPAIPATWNIKDVDVIPAQATKTQQDTTVKKARTVFTDLDLSQYLIPVSGSQKSNAKNMRDLDHFSAKKNKLASKEIYNSDQTINRNILDSFDENEVYNPSIPNMYQHYKAWTLEKKKLQLYTYLEKMKTRKNNNDSSDSISRSDQSSSSSYNSDSQSNSDSTTSSRKRHFKQDDSNTDYSSSGDDRASTLNSNSKLDNTSITRGPASVFPTSSKTGEEAYLARLRLSQKPVNGSESGLSTNGISSKPSSSNVDFQKAASEDTNSSKVIVLKNMVGINDVDEFLESETIAECSKFGKVLRCVVRTQAHQMDILKQPYDQVWLFVEFESLESSKLAVSDLNNRYFGGRSISATYFNESLYYRHL
ncbi:hypothetical protein BB561_004700 [Smittium simulii]|uniref:RRM domain-containing protein n=1 Tax=Smittium simulii TaxID=133385 RepID=A0A2T9YEY6_9FUNG|nr:hypothetical protein BB561_004700 [Smittium simulii]